MIPDLLTRVARKWAEEWGSVEDAILAACREVLEEAEKIVLARIIYHRENYPRGHGFCEDFGCEHFEEIAADLRALREGHDTSQA